MGLEWTQCSENHWNVRQRNFWKEICDLREIEWIYNNCYITEIFHYNWINYFNWIGQVEIEKWMNKQQLLYNTNFSFKLVFRKSLKCPSKKLLKGILEGNLRFFETVSTICWIWRKLKNERTTIAIQLKFFIKIRLINSIELVKLKLKNELNIQQLLYD